MSHATFDDHGGGEGVSPRYVRPRATPFVTDHVSLPGIDLTS